MIHHAKLLGSVQSRIRAGLEGSPLRFRATDGTYYLPVEDLREARAKGFELEILEELNEDKIPVRFDLPHSGAVLDPPPLEVRSAVLSRLLAEDRVDGRTHVRFLGRNRTVPPGGFQLDRAGGGRDYVFEIVDTNDLEARPTLEDRFQALRALVSDSDTKVVLSLGSGGLKLFSHATAIRLLDTIGCSEHFEEIWGCSAGAIVGLLYSHGLSPQAIEQTGYDLYSNRFEVSFRPTKLQLLRHLVRDALMPGSSGGASGFMDTAQALSLMLDRYCADIETHRSFYSVAFNIRECRSEVLTPCPFPEHLSGFLTQADAREAALASSTVPLLFVPRSIRKLDEDHPYIDGSTTEDVPLYSVVRKWDLDRSAGVETRSRLVILYVKLTGTLSQYRSIGSRIGKLRLLQMIASVGIDTMHQRDVELLNQRPDVDLLGLHLDDSSPDFFDNNRIPEFIRTAKETFPEQLMEIEQRLRKR